MSDPALAAFTETPQTRQSINDRKFTSRSSGGLEVQVKILAHPVFGAVFVSASNMVACYLQRRRMVEETKRRRGLASSLEPSILDVSGGF